MWWGFYPYSIYLFATLVVFTRGLMSAGFESIEESDILTYYGFTILAIILALYFTVLELL